MIRLTLQQEELLKKKVDLFKKFMQNGTVALVLATYIVRLSGSARFSDWLLAVLIAFVLALIIHLVVPLGAISEVLGKHFKSDFMKRFIDRLVLHVLYAFIITTVVTCVVLSIVNRRITVRVDGVESLLQEIEEDIKAHEETLADLDERTHEYIEVNAEYSDLKKYRSDFQGKVRRMENSKPSIGKTLPKAVCISFLLSYLLGVLTEPLYGRIGRKLFEPKDLFDDFE